jgi:apolipoprotein N-acyltransferase
VGLAPLLAALHGAGLRTALLLAWGWTLVASWVVCSWIPEAVTTYFLQPLALGYAFFFGVITGTGAVFYMAFAAVHRVLAGRLDPVWLPWAVAAAWVAAEFGRVRLVAEIASVSVPWGLLGYSQVGIDALVQVSSLFGVYGISFALVAANAGFAELGLALASRGAPRRRALAGAVLGLLPGAGIALFGAAALRAAPPDGGASSAGAVDVAVVQGHVSLGTRWRSEFYGQSLEPYLRGTREALAAQPAGTVFWPEAALTFFLDEEPLYARAIARALAAGDAELIAGGPRSSGGDDPRYFNSIFLLEPSGRIAAHYDKQVLVPFSEYFPLGRIDLLRRNFERVRVFTHGGPAALLPTRAGAAGVLTCNEAMMPELARERVRAGAAYLVNPSNDTWVPKPVFAEHLFDIVRLRAVEQRRWLVRASTSGPSALIDPWGRVPARSAPFSRALVRGRIAPVRETTLYALSGDLFALLCTASVPLALWRAARPATRW